MSITRSIISRSTPSHAFDELYLFAFDLDGCLANDAYHYLLTKIINTHFVFLKKYGKLEVIPDSDKEHVESSIKAILLQIDSCDANELENLPTFEYHPFYRTFFDSLLPYMALKYAEYKDDEEQLRDLAKGEINYYFIKLMQRISPEIHDRLVVKVNEKLFQFIIDQFNDPRLQNAVLVPATNRGSFIHNLAGMEQNGTESWHVFFNSILKRLKRVLPDKRIVIAPVSMADYYAIDETGEHAPLARGTSFVLMEEALKKESSPDIAIHANYIFDETKLPIAFALAQDFPNYQADIEAAYHVKLNVERVHLFIVDDQIPILETLNVVLDEHSVLLPESVDLTLYHYEGNEVKQIGKTITGAGKLDAAFPITLMDMVRDSGHPLENYSLPSNVAKNLDIKAFVSNRASHLLPDPSLSYSPSFFKKSVIINDAKNQLLTDNSHRLPASSSPVIARRR